MGASWGGHGEMGTGLGLLTWSYIEPGVWRSRDLRYEIRRGAIGHRRPGFRLFEIRGAEIVTIGTADNMRAIVQRANDHAEKNARPVHNLSPALAEVVASRPGAGMTDGSP